MRRRPILPLIQIPVVALGIDALALVCGEQLVVVPDAHAAAHHLANARHQDVDGFRQPLVVRVALHVEGLLLEGEVREEDGPVDLVDHFAFGGFGAGGRGTGI